MLQEGTAITESAIAFPLGNCKELASLPPLPASQGAPALRANPGRGVRTWVVSGLGAISTTVLVPHLAHLNCTRGRPTNCLSGRECCAPQLEQAAFIGSCGCGLHALTEYTGPSGVPSPVVIDSSPNLARYLALQGDFAEDVSTNELSHRTEGIAHRLPPVAPRRFVRSRRIRVLRLSRGSDPPWPERTRELRPIARSPRWARGSAR